MDFTSILDRVAWDFMFKILEKIGNLNVFVNIICLFFQNLICQLTWMPGLHKAFDLHWGVRHHWYLAPIFLFLMQMLIIWRLRRQLVTIPQGEFIFIILQCNTSSTNMHMTLLSRLRWRNLMWIKLAHVLQTQSITLGLEINWTKKCSMLALIGEQTRMACKHTNGSVWT